MSRLTKSLTKEQLQIKLFEQTIRPRKWQKAKDIIMPTKIAPIDQELLFSSKRRLRILELGSGWGEYAKAYLTNKPDCDYVAFEIKADRAQQTLKLVHKIPDTHFRIIPVNFNWFLTEILPPQSFDQVIINFPDPWPKRRHWKHRLIQKSFPERLKPILAPNAQVSIATDYGPYARKIISIFRQSERYKPTYTQPDYLRESPTDFFSTKFENIHKALGKKPYYMSWILK